MFVIGVTIFLSCGITYIGLATNLEGIVLRPIYSSTHITLRCTANEERAADYMIHLSCPFVKQGFCFSNCKPICKINEHNICVSHPELNMISECTLENSKKDQISTSYKINTALVNQTGDWRCSFKNQKSNPISIAKYEYPTTHSTPMTTTESQIQKNTIFVDLSKNEIRTVPSMSNINFTKESKATLDTTQYTGQSLLSKQLTRPEFVLALVVMLGFSLLLNLSFLIRCVLLKAVVDNYHRGIPNGSCILGCLCIDKYAKQKRYSRSLNLSNQVGSDFYRCQPMSPDNLAIYDDLSAVSNSSARLKLRSSNHSSDMDEETRLTNLIPNGSCHIGVGSVSTSLPRRYGSPGHATYFHPGIGNYVIVSGPIATQDQYTMGTAPPGYTIQMVSPIPSAPGSIVGGPGGNISVQSTHSDDLVDSDNSQTTNSVANQSAKLNTHPTELIDPNQILDLSQAIHVPINGFNPNRQGVINNQNNLNRSNGTVPLHPWHSDKALPPNSSSVISLPQYLVSENGAFIQQMRRLNEPILINSISISDTEHTS